MDVEIFGLISARTQSATRWGDLPESEREYMAKRVITELHDAGIPMPMCVRLIAEIAVPEEPLYELLWVPLGPAVRFNGADEPQPLFLGTSTIFLDT